MMVGSSGESACYAIIRRTSSGGGPLIDSHIPGLAPRHIRFAAGYACTCIWAVVLLSSAAFNAPQAPYTVATSMLPGLVACLSSIFLFKRFPSISGTNSLRHAGGSACLRRHVHVHASSTRPYCRPSCQRADPIRFFCHHPHHGMVRYVCTAESSRHYRAGRMRGKHCGVRLLGYSFVPARGGESHYLGPASSLGRPSSGESPKATFNRACLDAPCAKCFPLPCR